MKPNQFIHKVNLNNKHRKTCLLYDDIAATCLSIRVENLFTHTNNNVRFSLWWKRLVIWSWQNLINICYNSFLFSVNFILVVFSNVQWYMCPYLGSISSLIYISLNKIDILCLHIFVYILSSCCVDFYGIRRELVDETLIINWFPRTFCPFLGHYQILERSISDWNNLSSIESISNPALMYLNVFCYCWYL